MIEWMKQIATEVENAGSYEAKTSGGEFELIPDGIICRAIIDEAKWFSVGEGEKKAKKLSLRWMVVAPDEFDNKRVFQNLWVEDLDPAAKDGKKAEDRRDRDRQMLMAIDFNAGGGLLRTGDLSDENLISCLTNKTMVIRVRKMEPKDGGTKRNYVDRVEAKSHPTSSSSEVAAAKAKTSMASSAGSAAKGGRDLGDEIPF